MIYLCATILYHAAVTSTNEHDRVHSAGIAIVLLIAGIIHDLTS